MTHTMSDPHHQWTGYTVNNPAAWAPVAPVPPPAGPAPRYDLQNRGVKRQMSESDDCDDVFSEESSKDRCSSPGDDCQMGFSRKKRRGIIEKRRRDRINTSLSELRRLVPSAFEKQGSAKLEKAEILQMTVDHLKTLHGKGLDALAYDPHKFAMDYHVIGFRECAAEVARYLVTVEGMDIQDPLRLRLMSHLQCFATQRELAGKQAATPWNYNSYATGLHDYPATNAYDMSAPSQHQLPTPSTHVPPVPRHVTNPPPEHQHPPGGGSPRQGQLEPTRSQPVQSGYPSHHPYSQQYSGSGQVKPYRPWGAEVAY